MRRASAAAPRARVALLGILLLGGALRLSALDAGWFGVDQARDWSWAVRIATGEAFPAEGPLMRNRTHLGAGYYFFWALPALVSTKPLAAYAFAALLGVVAVWTAAILAERCGGAAAGLAAAAWIATAPTAVIGSRIAWAPAALPAATGVFLLVVRRFLAQPSRLAAVAVLASAALATQLHLAATTLLFIGFGVLLVRFSAIGLRGIAIALVAGAIPLLPMAAGWLRPLPASERALSAASPYAHRMADLALAVPRWLDGLSPIATARPAATNLWLAVEAAAVALPVVVAALALLWPFRDTERATLRSSAATALACIAVPAAIPAEAWLYYLDCALVPSAVVLGVFFTRPPWRRAGAAVVAALALGRTAFLIWWISSSARAGLVQVNLDELRLGGPRPAPMEARARLLSIATKERAADVLVRELGLSPRRLRNDAHGPAFGDLDTDNGYFFLTTKTVSGEAEPVPEGRQALVVYRDELPAQWLAGFAAPRRAGPLDIHPYVPVAETSAARLENCGGGAPPLAAEPDPLDYGSGEPRLPAWPCSHPVVAVPFRESPDDVKVRVVPRVVGAGRVLRVETEPSGRSFTADAPGLGVGVELGARGGTLRVWLELDGPARLDLVELHGRGDGGRAPS